MQADHQVQITFRVPADEASEVRKTLLGRGAQCVMGPTEGFDGGQTFDLLVTLTPSVAALIAGIYAARQRSKQFVSLKYKGLEVKGVSEATLLKLLDRTSS